MRNITVAWNEWTSGWSNSMQFSLLFCTRSVSIWCELLMADTEPSDLRFAILDLPQSDILRWQWSQLGFSLSLHASYKPKPRWRSNISISLSHFSGFYLYFLHSFYCIFLPDFVSWNTSHPDIKEVWLMWSKLSSYRKKKWKHLLWSTMRSR